MVELFETSYRAHYKYMKDVLRFEKDKKYFQKAFMDIIYVVSYMDGNNSLKVLKNEITKYKRRESHFNDNQYYARGYELAMMVLETLERRFV